MSKLPVHPLVSFAAPLESTFAISGVITRDSAAIARVEKSLQQDGLIVLHREIARYLEDNEIDPASVVSSLSAATSVEELRAPTAVINDDHSLSRVSGLVTVSVFTSAELVRV
jgi:hypothetical protein